MTEYNTTTVPVRQTYTGFTFLYLPGGSEIRSVTVEEVDGVASYVVRFTSEGGWWGPGPYPSWQMPVECERYYLFTGPSSYSGPTVELMPVRYVGYVDDTTGIWAAGPGHTFVVWNREVGRLEELTLDWRPPSIIG